jgi:hypothetical protein
MNIKYNLPTCSKLNHFLKQDQHLLLSDFFSRAMESTDDSLSDSSQPDSKVELPLTQQQDAGLEKNKPLPSYSAQKEGVAQGPGVGDKDAYLVEFDGGDPNNPINFPSIYKIWLVLQMSMLAFCGLGGASIIAPSVPMVAGYLNSSIEVQVLMIALFLLGWYSSRHH